MPKSFLTGGKGFPVGSGSDAALVMQSTQPRGENAAHIGAGFSGVTTPTGGAVRGSMPCRL